MSLKENQSEKKKWKTIMKWSGVGVEFAGVIFLFCFFGYKLDEKFQTSFPWFFLACFFVGFVGMLYIIIKDTRNLWKD
jgi:F0F1-type ATP synthase assembly protein I